MEEGRVGEVPTFIVLDVPSPAAEKIRLFRSKFDPARENIPVEITLTGSCGVGSVSPGQKISEIAREMDRIGSRFTPFANRFKGVERFAHTNIYFLTMIHDAPFAALHRALAASAIRFEPNDYPYRPHCTLKLRSIPSEEELLDLFFLKAPEEEMLFSVMSLYTIPEANSCELLHKCELSGTEPPFLC